jgi:hypothetical protein
MLTTLEDVSLSDISSTLNQFDKIIDFNTDLIDNKDIIDIVFTSTKCNRQTIIINNINTGKYNIEKTEIYCKGHRIEMGTEFYPLMELINKYHEYPKLIETEPNSIIGEPKSSLPIMERMKDDFFNELQVNTPFGEDHNKYNSKCIHRLNGNFTLDENSDGTYTCTQCGAILKLEY